MIASAELPCLSNPSEIGEPLQLRSHSKFIHFSVLSTVVDESSDGYLDFFLAAFLMSSASGVMVMS